MHRVDYWYKFGNTIDHKTITAGWIDSQMFEDGSAIIIIRNEKGTKILRSIQVREIIMIDIDRFFDASLAQ